MSTRRTPLVIAALSVVAAACSSTEPGAESTPASTGDVTTTSTVTTTLPESTTTVAPTTTAAPTTTTTTTTTTTVVPPEPLPFAPPDGMELVWSDEFDGDAIDAANWKFDIGGWGWGNGEAQYYTDRSENARVEDGMLVIELRREDYDGSSFTSARLKSQGLQEFQYGRMEARIRVPQGAGTWPAFWMLGTNFARNSSLDERKWPNVGEIDIMEYVGREPDLVIGTLHGPGYAGAGAISRWNRVDFELADDFHLFAIDWDETGITWLFDGEPYATIPRERVGDREWVFDQPFFFLLNLALGGTLGGNFALDLQFPLFLYVDHVRVYQRSGG
jgi:beta-glucanase (GH16 family)